MVTSLQVLIEGILISAIKNKHFLEYLQNKFSLEFLSNLHHIRSADFWLISADLMDPHCHTGVLSASQYDLPQYLHKMLILYALCYFLYALNFYLTDTCTEGEVIPTNFYQDK